MKYMYPVEGCSEIHMIWTDTPLDHLLERRQQIHRGHAEPEIEFMLAQHPWLENDCLFADIILPVNTKFEEDDIGADVGSGQFDTSSPKSKCIEPLGESKSDYEIVCMIAERLGLLEE